MPPALSRPSDVVARVRRFNRFYTERIGVLTEHVFRSAYSLLEVRILYEIAHRETPTAGAIAGAIGLDRGYMSRILTRLRRQGIVTRTTAPNDARVRILSLTAKGRRIFRTLDARANEDVVSLLGKTPPGARTRLVAAMRTIEEVLAPDQRSDSAYTLRDPHPGDFGWVVHRHGVLYSQEYGYDEHFEALVARIVADYVTSFDPRHDRCWIAEKDGEVVGSVFLVRQSRTVGRLRLLYVEPSARGLGIGARLVGECVRFARQVRYRTLRLWTQSELHAARRLYERAGFVRVAQEPHESFGRDDLVAETWELTL